MTSLLRPAISIFLLLSALTGVVYPLIVTAVARVFFPDQAGGSIVTREGVQVGSALIGQEFSGDPGCFWGRLSATGPVPYTSFNAEKATGSSGSNLAPTNPALIENARARIDALRAADESAGHVRAADQRIPVDVATASGSGLDPHISLAGAEFQIGRVAKARGLPEEQVRSLVRRCSTHRQLGFLGEPVVNVLELNLALDALHRSASAGAP